MTNWFIDNHHAYLLRLAGLLVVFGTLWLGVRLLVLVRRGLLRRVARRVTAQTRIPRASTT